MLITGFYEITTAELFDLTSNYIERSNQSNGEDTSEAIYNLCAKYHEPNGTTAKENETLVKYFNSANRKTKLGY